MTPEWNDGCVTISPADADSCLHRIVDLSLPFLVLWVSLIPEAASLVFSFSTPTAKEAYDYDAT